MWKIQTTAFRDVIVIIKLASLVYYSPSFVAAAASECPFYLSLLDPRYLDRNWGYGYGVSLRSTTEHVGRLTAETASFGLPGI